MLSKTDRSTANSQSSELLSQKGMSLVNKCQNILHASSLDANSMAIIILASIVLGVYK